MNHSQMMKTIYNNVISQTLSESGRFLFAGNRFGDIFVQNMDELDNAEMPRPKAKLYPQGDSSNEINSLAFHRDFLIVGAIGVIYGLKWNEDICKLATTRAWEVKIPLTPDAMEVPDVNSLWLQKETDTLYAGCGDNNIYQISLEDGRIQRKFEAHTDYIHCVAGSDQQLYSASEDGTVRVWSLNQKEPTAMLEPYKQAMLKRPEMGNWIGAVAVNADWLVCGGGPRLSLWHLRTLECTRDFPFPGKIHCCDFIDDSIIVAGEYQTAQLYALSGDTIANIPLEHTAAYSIVWQQQPHKFMSISGYSNKLHILQDFRFLDSKITLYGNLE